MFSAGEILSGISAGLHVYFFYLESISFKSSPRTQRIFIGRAGENNADLVKVSSSLLFNQGFYNLFLALGTLFGLFANHPILIRFTLLFYVAAGAVLFISSPTKYQGAVIQSVPALLALLLLK